MSYYHHELMFYVLFSDFYFSSNSLNGHERKKWVFITSYALLSTCRKAQKRDKLSTMIYLIIIMQPKSFNIYWLHKWPCPLVLCDLTRLRGIYFSKDKKTDDEKPTHKKSQNLIKKFSF